MTLHRTTPQARYSCADCGEPAGVYLPEGRYLCQSCWKALKALRLAVVKDMAARGRKEN